MLLGHLAASTLLHRCLNVDILPVTFGAIFPDVVDKTLCQVLHLTPSGRMYAHTLLSLMMTTSLVGWLKGPNLAWGWGVGYLSHLLCDIGGFVPWFYPFMPYDFKPNQSNLSDLFIRIFNATRPLELLLIVAAILSLVIKNKRKYFS